MKKLFLILSFIISTISLSLVSSCQKNEKYHQAQGAIWNTVWHLTFSGAENLSDSVIPILKEIGNSVSVFDDNSICCLVNKNDSVIVDRHFSNVYLMSKKINILSDGIFDPTLGPLIEIWGFGKNHKVSADTAKIDSVMPYIGINKTKLENNRLIKENPKISFNFSAIAKGYGCDGVAEMLRRNGVNDFLIEIGGEIFASGNSPRGKKWNISVDRPIVNGTPGQNSECVLAVSDHGVATSGNYRNFHSDNNNRIFGHTIDPKTGHPAATDILSTTVIANSAMEADALATALFASGSKKARYISEKHDLAVMLILSDSSQWMSKKFTTFLFEEPASTNRN